MINISQYEIGNPIKYHYENVGFISPTQIRYAKILNDLHNLFGTLQEKTIVEVGVGNGGQAVQICNFERIRKYFLVDLPEVLALTSTAVLPYGILDRLEFIPPNELTKIQSDLFISNYAFSELGREVQEKYFTELISKSPRGYVIYNHITPKNFNTMTAVEFASRITGAKLLEEYVIRAIHLKRNAAEPEIGFLIWQFVARVTLPSH
jgi:putative sugar O-methyltransferase